MTMLTLEIHEYITFTGYALNFAFFLAIMYIYYLILTFPIQVFKALHSAVSTRSLIPLRVAPAMVAMRVSISKAFVIGLAVGGLWYWIETRIAAEEVKHILWYGYNMTFFLIKNWLGNVWGASSHQLFKQLFKDFTDDIHSFACQLGYSDVYCYWDVPISGDYSAPTWYRGSLNIFSWAVWVHSKSPFGPSPYPWEVEERSVAPIPFRFMFYEALVGLPIVEFHIWRVMVWLLFDFMSLVALLILYLNFKNRLFNFDMLRSYHVKGKNFLTVSMSFAQGGVERLIWIASNYPTLALSYLSDDPNDQTVIVGVTHDNGRTGYGLEGQYRPESIIRNVFSPVDDEPSALGVEGNNVTAPVLTVGVPVIQDPHAVDQPVVAARADYPDDHNQPDEEGRLRGQLFEALMNMRARLDDEGSDRPEPYDADADTDTTVSTVQSAPGAQIVFEENELDENHFDPVHFEVANDQHINGDADPPVIVAHAEPLPGQDPEEPGLDVLQTPPPIGDEMMEIRWRIVVNNVVAAARLNRWGPETLHNPVQQLAFRNWIPTQSHLMSSIPVNWISDHLEDIVLAASLPTDSWMRMHAIANPGWYQRFCNWLRGGDPIQYRLDIAREAGANAR